jgi:FkbM family methyltransferase
LLELLVFQPQAMNRLSLIGEKVAGHRPALTWRQLAGLMAPGRMQVSKLRADGAAPCPVLWHTNLGEFWGRVRDDELLPFLMFEHLHDSAYQEPPVVVRAGDVVLDAGAHLGTFSRLALERGARLVIAFEPEPTNCACFKRTFHREIAEGQVILIEAALWDSPGTLDFAPPEPGNSGTGSTALGGGSLKVRATTVDAEIARLGTRVDFIKMDTEGAEPHIIRGARATITRFRPRMAISTEHTLEDWVLIPSTVLSVKRDYHMKPGTSTMFFY